MTVANQEVLMHDSIQFGGELFAAAEQYVGRPYVSHAAIVQCGARKTRPACMELGLDEHGFDCAGIIIRAASDVLGYHDTDWAWNIRHTAQIAKELSHIDKVRGEELTVGTPMVYSHTANGLHVPAAHIGLFAGDDKILHARSYVKNGRLSEEVRVDSVKAPWASKKFNFAIEAASLARAAIGRH